MNDHEVTKQRQAEHTKNGIQKGFPVHAVRNLKTDEIAVFFTKRGLDLYLKKLSMNKDWYNYKLIYVNDVENVNFNTL